MIFRTLSCLEYREKYVFQLTYCESKHFFKKSAFFIEIVDSWAWVKNAYALNHFYIWLVLTALQ